MVFDTVAPAAGVAATVADGWAPSAAVAAG